MGSSGCLSPEPASVASQQPALPGRQQAASTQVGETPPGRLATNAGGDAEKVHPDNVPTPCHHAGTLALPHGAPPAAPQPSVLREEAAPINVFNAPPDRRLGPGLVPSEGRELFPRRCDLIAAGCEGTHGDTSAGKGQGAAWPHRPGAAEGWAMRIRALLLPTRSPSAPQLCGQLARPWALPGEAPARGPSTLDACPQ